MNLSQEELSAMITVAGKFAIEKTRITPATPDPPSQDELMRAFVDAYVELNQFLNPE